jgi:beta-hydroxyacyl-ACP dehydratase FabZ
MNIEQITDLIPHRYPLLLVDRIVEYVPGEKIVGLKNVTMNEQFFQGHFPGKPVMPGVLVLEAMAQTGAVLAIQEFDQTENTVIYFLKIDKAKFRQTVVPGDQLVMTAEVLDLRRKICKIWGTARVDNKIVAEAEFVSMLVKRDSP